MNVCNIRAFDSSDNQYILDVKGKQSFPTTFELANITELKNSKGGFNKSIDLPATKNNIEYFGAYWDVNEEGDFNPKQKHRAILEYDTVKVLDGFIQLVEVRVENGRYAEYNVRLFSDEATLFKVTSKKLLNELDLSDFEHEATLSNIATGFTGYTTSGGETIYYGLQDYGDQINGEGTDEDGDLYPTTDSNKHLCFKCKPYFKLKTILDLIMSESGYTYESTFLTGTYFNKLYMLAHSRTGQIVTTAEDFSLAKAGLSAEEIIPFGTSEYIGIDDYSSFDFYNPNNLFQYDGVFDRGTYVPLVSNNQLGYYKFRVSMNFRYYDFVAGTITFVLRHNGTGGTANLDSGSFTIDTSDPQLDPLYETVVFEGYGNFLDGSYEVVVSSTANTVPANMPTLLPTADTFIEVIEGPVIPNGDIPSTYTLDFLPAKNVPSETVQSDVLEFLDTRFNCVFVKDKVKPNHFKIEPYIDYIEGGAEKDWSKKLDVSKTYTIKPMSSFEKREVVFETKEGEDLINKLVKENSGRIYGRQKFLNDVNDFATGVKKIVSPDVVTPLNNVSGTEINIPRLYTDDLSPVKGDLRVFVKGGEYAAVQVDGLGEGDLKLRDSSNNVSSNIDYFTHFGHYEEPIPEVETTDLNFGVERPFHPIITQPTGTCYDRFWKTYLDQIYGEEARMLTAYFNLTLQDIEAFEFSDKIWVLNAWWTVNKIDGFDPLGENTTRVELIRFSTALNGMKSIEAGEREETTTSRTYDGIK